MGDPTLVLGGAVDDHARRQHSHPEDREPAIPTKQRQKVLTGKPLPIPQPSCQIVSTLHPSCVMPHPSTPKLNTSKPRLALRLKAPDPTQCCRSPLDLHPPQTGPESCLPAAAARARLAAGKCCLTMLILLVPVCCMRHQARPVWGRRYRLHSTRSSCQAATLPLGHVPLCKKVPKKPSTGCDSTRSRYAARCGGRLDRRHGSHV